MLDPGLDVRRLAATDRAAIRTEIGLEDPSLRLAAVLGDPSDQIEGMIGMMSVGLANESGRRVRVVMSPRAAAVNRAVHVLDSANRRSTMMVNKIAEEPWRLLGACDLAVVMAGAHSAAWAMAAGVPIVAADRPELRRLLEPDRTARFGRADSCAELAAQVCRTLDEPDKSRAMAQAARADFERRFTAAGLAPKLRELWMG
jgi:glycosyltransferase involved in cell wall biosynthesis